MSDYYLPPEIWEEIFHRLPVKSLLICLSVCKDWKSLITDQFFIQQSANNTNNSLFLQFHCRGQQSMLKLALRRYDKVFSIYSDNQLLDVTKLPPNNQAINYNDSDNFAVVGTCNGLVCLTDQRYYATFIIMNQFIRKYVVLPKSITGPPLESSHQFNWACAMLGFGFDSKTNDFVVVKVSLSYWEKTTPWLELFSLKTRKWRSITGIGPSVCFSSGGNKRGQIFMNGALHWLVYGNQFGHGRRNVILSFDLDTETFGEFSLPSCLDFQSHSELSLLKGGNSLALVYTKRRSSIFNIWVMKEYGNVDSWNMIFSFDSTSYGDIKRVIALRNSGELVLQRFSQEMIFLDPKKDLVKCSGLRVYDVNFAGDVEESLFMINEENNASLISDIINIIN